MLIFFHFTISKSEILVACVSMCDKGMQLRVQYMFSRRLFPHCVFSVCTDTVLNFPFISDASCMDIIKTAGRCVLHEKNKRSSDLEARLCFVFFLPPQSGTTSFCTLPFHVLRLSGVGSISKRGLELQLKQHTKENAN